MNVKEDEMFQRKTPNNQIYRYLQIINYFKSKQIKDIKEIHPTSYLES